MRHFHRRIRLYGVAGQIYKLVGEEPFTLEDLLEAGIDIHQSNRVNLRTRGAVTHPPDTENPSPYGVTRPRRVSNEQGAAKYWILTPEAVRVIRKELGEIDDDED
jgi:hypothetical protein